MTLQTLRLVTPMKAFALTGLLLCVTLAVVHAPAAEAAAVALNPTNDVFVRENGTSSESWQRLRTKTGAGTRKQSFLTFDTSIVTGNLIEAKLRLYVYSDGGAFEVVESKSINVWKDLPGDVWTWEDKYPWCGSAAIASGRCRSTGSRTEEWICGNGQDCSGSFVDVDVTDLVSWELGGDGTVMFGLQQRAGEVVMSSSEDPNAASRRPTLTIVTGSADATHGPGAGGVTATSARLWLRTDTSAVVDFRVSTSPTMTNARTSGSVTTVAEKDFTAHIPVTNLQPNTRYYYQPRINGSPVAYYTLPYFLTAPTEGAEQEFTFVVLSDFQSITQASASVTPETFYSAGSELPVFAIVGGDVDHRNPGFGLTDLELIREHSREMYRQNLDPLLPRRTDLIEFIQRRGAIAHLWDDHDYCCNDSDGRYVGKHVALATYDEYWPSYDRPAPDDGIYQTWTWGHVQFFLLDGRFHRTESDADDDGGKTMLGLEQKAWLKNELVHSNAVWKVLLSGSVFNPTVKCGSDNWCDYRTEGREIAEFIEDNRVGNVVILSGDIHAGAITDGTNSVYNTPWEMAVPGADAVEPGCDTTTYQGPDRFGEWTHGTWGEGFRTEQPPRTCWGFGQVDVLTNPHRLILSVKGELGQTMVQATVPADESNGEGAGPFIGNPGDTPNEVCAANIAGTCDYDATMANTYPGCTEGRESYKPSTGECFNNSSMVDCNTNGWPKVAPYVTCLGY